MFHYSSQISVLQMIKMPLLINRKCYDANVIMGLQNISMTKKALYLKSGTWKLKMQAFAYMFPPTLLPAHISPDRRVSTVNGATFFVSPEIDQHLLLDKSRYANLHGCHIQWKEEGKGFLCSKVYDRLALITLFPLNLSF